MVTITLHRPNSDDSRLRFAMLGLQVCKSLNWHDVTRPFPKPVTGASCFILKIDDRYIGITANHVVTAFSKMKGGNPNLASFVMHAEIDLEGAILSRSERRDIATFEIPAELIDEGLKPGILHYENWPAALPQKNDPVMVIGYPEAMKTNPSAAFIEFQAWSALEIIEDVTGREIIIAYDPARCQSMLKEKGLPPANFNLSGCSGGPVLIFRNNGDYVDPIAAGVITTGPNDGSSGVFEDIAVVHAARLDCMGRDGSLPED